MPTTRSVGTRVSGSRSSVGISETSRVPESPSMPTTADSITLLHVSDMQFGRNHRFGPLGALDPDASFDTLLQRLIDDLGALKKDHGLSPQLVVASGDLAEMGLPKEFEDARQLLVKLTEFLGLSRDRAVIVPGNHDINRK